MREKRGGVSAGCVNMYSQINAIVVKLLYMGMIFNTRDLFATGYRIVFKALIIFVFVCFRC